MTKNDLKLDIEITIDGRIVAYVVAVYPGGFAVIWGQNQSVTIYKDEDLEYFNLAEKAN